jgi:hypothetical protein
VLGAPLDITPSSHTPPGRGYARLGIHPPVRLQVPAAPDPLDEETPADLRDAVIALLPHTDSRTEAAAALSLAKGPTPMPAGLVLDHPESPEERTGEIRTIPSVLRLPS